MKHTERLQIYRRPEQIAAALGYPGWTLSLQWADVDYIFCYGPAYEVTLERPIQEPPK